MFRRRGVLLLPVLSLTSALLLLAATACDEVGVGTDEPIENHDDTFNVGGEITLDVDSFNGGITVTGSERGSIRVKATVKRADHVDYSATQFGSDVQVRATQTRSVNFNGPGVTLEIEAPSNAQITLRTSNGAIEISGFDAGADLQTSNGRITVTNLQGDLKARTSNGRIEVRNLTGSAVLDTSNGSILFSGGLVAGSENDMESSNGSITVDLDDNPSIVFDGSTSNGSVSSEFPILVTSSGSSHLRGAIGSGAAELTARTSNGSITLK